MTISLVLHRGIFRIANPYDYDESEKFLTVCDYIIIGNTNQSKIYRFSYGLARIWTKIV